MADIELVIKMPENTYKRIQALANSGYFEDDICGNSMRRIANGTPLPKGHGRIGDLDALRCEYADFDTYNDYCLMFDEIDNADTIIEADKEDDMGISEEKMKIVINNYFKKEFDVNMSIREAFEKGFRIGVQKGTQISNKPTIIEADKEEE